MERMKGKYYVGMKKVSLRDELKNISFNVFIHYPTLTPSKPSFFGPYEMDVSVNGDILKGRFPLVIISHGSGGSPLLHRSISTFLAKNGYMVALIEHYGNNRTNNELEGKNENFANRLRHLVQTIDYFLEESPFAAYLQKDNVAVIGHSIGANASLVIAGGVPIPYNDYNRQFGETAHLGEEPQQLDLIIDHRIKAMILFALLPGWFVREECLRNVHIPILIVNAEKDDYVPEIQTKKFLEISSKFPLIKFEIIKNASHFSFLSPFPISIKERASIAAKDPLGFDREKFHLQLNAQILDFLSKKLVII
jgi:predicted dienelactone hydrolase